MKDQLQTIREALENSSDLIFKDVTKSHLRAQAFTALAQLEAMVGEPEPVALAQIEHTVGGSIEHMPLKAAWKLPMGVRFDLYAAPVAQQPQAPTESVLIDGIAYDTPAPVAAELLRLHLGLKQPQAEAVPPTHVLAEAERYRWLRDKSVPPHNFYLSVPEEFHGVRYQPHEVDAYIDAAIAAAKKKEAGHE